MKMNDKHSHIKVIPSELYALLHSCVEYTYEEFKDGLVSITIDGKEAEPSEFERLLALTKRFVKPKD